MAGRSLGFGFTLIGQINSQQPSIAGRDGTPAIRARMIGSVCTSQSETLLQRLCILASIAEFLQPSTGGSSAQFFITPRCLPDTIAADNSVVTQVPCSL